MDFFIGFLCGYFVKEIFKYLKQLSLNSYDKNYNWETIVFEKDDLP